MTIVGWVAGFSLGLIAIAVIVAVIDNRLNYGRWVRRRKGSAGQVGPP
jgi:hypothetical protein